MFARLKMLFAVGWIGRFFAHRASGWLAAGLLVAVLGFLWRLDHVTDELAKCRRASSPATPALAEELIERNNDELERRLDSTDTRGDPCLGAPNPYRLPDD